MTPDDVQKAADLLEQWRTHQANLVNWSQAPLAIWADGRALAIPGLSDAVRGVLMDVADGRLRTTAAQLKDLGVDPPVMDKEVRSIVDNPRRELDLFTGHTAMAVLEDEGRTVAAAAQLPLTGNDRMPGGGA